MNVRFRHLRSLSASLVLTLATPLIAMSDDASARPQPEKAPGAQAAAAGRQRVRIVSECQVSATNVFVHAEFDMTFGSSAPPELRPYLKRSHKEGRGRYLWQVDCSRGTMQCWGVHIDLSPADIGEPIKSSDVAAMRGAELKIVKNDLAIIEWGEYVLSLDLRRKTLSLAFDLGSMRGRGVGRCGEAMWVGF